MCFVNWLFLSSLDFRMEIFGNSKFNRRPTTVDSLKKEEQNDLTPAGHILDHSRLSDICLHLDLRQLRRLR